MSPRVGRLFRLVTFCCIIIDASEVYITRFFELNLSIHMLYLHRSKLWLASEPESRWDSGPVPCFDTGKVPDLLAPL